MQGPSRYVLSGCSGGGKSTLLAELANRGFATVEEPGRRIVREEQERGGDALPWVNPQAFAARALDMAVEAFERTATLSGPVFFDRSFVDAVSYLAHLNGVLSPEHAALIRDKRYEDTVFLVPPWPENFVNDAERKLGFNAAIEEYKRLCLSYDAYCYAPVILPKSSIDERIAVILSCL